MVRMRLAERSSSADNSAAGSPAPRASKPTSPTARRAVREAEPAPGPRKARRQSERARAAAATVLQSHARRAAAARATAKERRRVALRQRIVAEILGSELSYQDSLRVLDEHYMQQVMWRRAHAMTALPSVAQSPRQSPVGRRMARRGSVDSNLGSLRSMAARSAALDSRLDFPTAEEVDTMFCSGSLMCLLDLSRQLTSHIDATLASGQRLSAGRVGEIFVQLAPRFLIFSEYCKRVESAMAAVTRCQTVYPTFAQFIAHLQSVPASPASAADDGAGGTLDLHSYLIMPVQRVPRYVMLLAELLETIAPEEKSSRVAVSQALEVVRGCAEQIDLAVGAEQRRKRLEQISHGLLDAPPGFIHVPANGRVLLREGRLQLVRSDAAEPAAEANTSVGSLLAQHTPSKGKGSAATGLTPSRLSLTPITNRLRRKSIVESEPALRGGDHLAVLFSDVLLVTKPCGLGMTEQLRCVDCAWLHNAAVEEVDSDGFRVTMAEQEHSHTLIALDSAARTSWVEEISRAIEAAPEPPAQADCSGHMTPVRGTPGADSNATPFELSSPLPTTPVRALKMALQRGRRSSTLARARATKLRRHSTVDTKDMAAAAAAVSPMCAEDGSLVGDALPESDADAAALRDAMHEQLHALIALDMRRYLLQSECLGTLREWATESDWAHDTGGGPEERRAERGVWLRLFAEVQQELAPQFGLDVDAIAPPVLDSPAGRADAEQPVAGGCSPVLEAGESELPVLALPSSDQGEDAERLTVQLPPLSSTPLSTRCAAKRPSACCAASTGRSPVPAATPPEDAAAQPQSPPAPPAASVVRASPDSSELAAEADGKTDARAGRSCRGSGPARRRRRRSSLACCAAPVE